MWRAWSCGRNCCAGKTSLPSRRRLVAGESHVTTWIWTVRELRRRPARTLLTLFGIAIGVAIVVASLTAIRGARGAYHDLFDTTGGRPTCEVVASGAAGF